jgi:hypothetical protein
VLLCNHDLLQNEFQIRFDERNHGVSPIRT